MPNGDRQRIARRRKRCAFYAMQRAHIDDVDRVGARARHVETAPVDGRLPRRAARRQRRPRGTQRAGVEDVDGIVFLVGNE